MPSFADNFRTQSSSQSNTATAVLDAIEAASPQAQKAFQDAIQASSIDTRLLQGPFASNVWAGRYAVSGLLGSGAQGTTFVGNDLKTGGRVAIKVFDLAKAQQWKSVELFEREVKTLKSIEHAGMPSFLDVIADEKTGARALVMSFVEGERYDNVVKHDGPLHEAQLWRMLDDVSSILEKLHGNASPLVHRDVKPSNLIKRPDGTTALIDFGGVGQVRSTAGSTVVGTFGYMAPEQLYGTQGPQVDVYALGATLLTLATGVEPEEQPRQGLALDVDKAAARLSLPLRTLLKNMLEPDPSKRIADAQILRQQLKKIANPDAAQRDAKTNRAQQVYQNVDTQYATQQSVLDGYPNGDENYVGDFDAAEAVFAIVLGIVGTIFVSIFGSFAVPLFMTILGGLTGGETKRRLQSLREEVRSSARSARQRLLAGAKRGFQTLKIHERQEQQRRVEWRLSRQDRRRQKIQAWVDERIQHQTYSQQTTRVEISQNGQRTVYMDGRRVDSDDDKAALRQEQLLQERMQQLRHELDDLARRDLGAWQERMDDLRRWAERQARRERRR